MAGLFGTLNTARNSINAHQVAINTATHNIANSQDENYTRQRVDLSASRATDYYTSTGRHQLGTGVDIQGISRVRDFFLDVQIRDENGNFGKYKARDEFMSEIETLTLEPSTADDGKSSLSELMGQMWDSWQKYQGTPQNSNTKTGIVEASLSVTNELNRLYKQFDKIYGDCVSQAGQKVQTFNSKLQQISDLSEQITAVMISGGQPNDLLDKRDVLIDDISKMMDIKVIQGDYGKIQITTTSPSSGSDITIFDDKDFLKLSFNPDNVNPDNSTISWSDGDPTTPDITDSISSKGGSIAGYISVTQKVTEYKKSLDTMAVTIAAAVNTLHNTYFDNTTPPGTYKVYDPSDSAHYIDIFKPLSGSTISAGNITVNSVLQDDSNKLRGGLTTAESDTRIALAIAQIKDQNFDISSIEDKVPAAGQPAFNIADYIKIDPNNLGFQSVGSGTTETIGSFYQGLILKIGSFAGESKNMTSGQEELINQLLTRKDSTSGVNRDEETANLVQFEHSLNASFKVISVVDELLQSIINLIR